MIQNQRLHGKSIVLIRSLLLITNFDLKDFTLRLQNERKKLELMKLPNNYYIMRRKSKRAIKNESANKTRKKFFIM